MINTVAQGVLGRNTVLEIPKADLAKHLLLAGGD